MFPKKNYFQLFDRNYAQSGVDLSSLQE